MARVLRAESDELRDKAREYVRLSKMIDDLEEKRAALKSYLSDVVDSTGESDEKGHRTLKFSEPVEGVAGFKRERRVTRSYADEDAEIVMKARGIRERVMKTVEVVDQDEVMACLAEEILDETEVERMFPAKVSWAFKTLK